MAGVQLGGRCDADEASALAAYAAGQTGAVYTAGGSSLVVTASAPAVGGVTLDLLDLATGAAVQRAVPLTVRPCTLLDWDDALEFQGLATVAVVSVFAVVVLKRALL